MEREGKRGTQNLPECWQLWKAGMPKVIRCQNCKLLALISALLRLHVTEPDYKSELTLKVTIMAKEIYNVDYYFRVAKYK